MGADSYTVCPRCASRPTPKAEAQRAAQAAYGKVSEAEYQRLAREVATKAGERPESLRENYEFWIQDFELRVRYSAGCSVCGFRFSFKHVAPMLAPKERVEAQEIREIEQELADDDEPGRAP